MGIDIIDINSKKIARGLKQYQEIMQLLWEVDVSNDVGFQKKISNILRT